MRSMKCATQHRGENELGDMGETQRRNDIFTEFLK